MRNRGAFWKPFALLAVVSVVMAIGIAAEQKPCEKPEARPAKVKPKPADNSRCLVCHGNYDEEGFAVHHAKHGIGCEKCHGPSDDHAGDENHTTPPDIMYPADKVNPACLKCHDRTKLAKLEKHLPFWDEIAANTQQCTDCHGKHRLARRTVRWDKVTRKFLETK